MTRCYRLLKIWCDVEPELDDKEYTNRDDFLKHVQEVAATESDTSFYYLIWVFSSGVNTLSIEVCPFTENELYPDDETKSNNLS